MKIGVVGSGTMGTGIAQVVAASGSEVHLFDSDRTALEGSKDQLQKILTRLVGKGRITETDKSSILNNIGFETKLDGLSKCDLIIEAIVENFEVKKEVFQQLERLVEPDSILATNTSSLSVTALGGTLNDPSRFLGIHFFNPAPLMKLVEVVPALQTEARVTDKALELLNNWGKMSVVAKDTPGFIVNKVARPYYSEALRILDEGIADHLTIDTAMKEMGGFRMGPFELMDFIGNDVNFMVTATMFQAFYSEPRYRPSFTQKRLVDAGYLGRKTGRGYYYYSDQQPSDGFELDHDLGRSIFERILAMLINEAADTVHYGIASKTDVDLAMTYGVNYPKGLLQWADDIGIDKCVKMMDDLYEFYHEDRYRCSGLLRQMATANQRFFEAAVHG